MKPADFALFVCLFSADGSPGQEGKEQGDEECFHGKIIQRFGVIVQIKRASFEALCEDYLLFNGASLGKTKQLPMTATSAFTL